PRNALKTLRDGALTYICTAPNQNGFACSGGNMKSTANDVPRAILASAPLLEASLELSRRVNPDGLTTASPTAPCVRLVVVAREATRPWVTVHPLVASKPRTSAFVSALLTLATSVAGAESQDASAHNASAETAITLPRQ